MIKSEENTMINFAQIKQLFALETEGKYCVEILFSVRESKKFESCWMGKLYDKKIGRDVYWFGLTADGKNAFDYATFEELSNAEVFDGRSLFEIWDTVTVKEIDGCDPAERLSNYIGENKGSYQLEVEVRK